MKRSKRLLLSLATVSVVVALPLLVSSCKKDEPNTPNTFDGQYGYGQQQQYGQQGYDPNTGYQQQPGYQQPGYQDPNQGQPTTQQPATASDPVSQIAGMMGGILGGFTGGTGDANTTTSTGTDAVSIAIQTNARANAPGMTPQGQAVRLNLQQGQTAEAQISLAAGKCYTLIAGSQGTIFEAEIIALIPGVNSEIGRNASGANPMPVVWGGTACYKSQLPIGSMPVTLRVTAKMGAGTLGIQPYAK